MAFDPFSSPGRAVRIVVGVVALGLLAWAGASFLERRQKDRETRAMADRFRETRAATDRCRNQLAREEEAFRRLDGRVDSLLSEVRRYESEEGGGVPESEYETYLEVFDRYNESVERWEDRVAALRARETTCRRAVEMHNALVDSLRDRLGTGAAGAPEPAGGGP